MKRPIEDGFSLLIGAGIGAAVMYLLDPDQGSGRRKQIRESAQDAISSAGTAASGGLEGLRNAADKAAQYAHHLASSVNDAADSGSDAASYLRTGAGAGMSALAAQAAKAAKDAYERLHSHASAAQDGIAEFGGRAGDAADDARSNFSDKFGDLRKHFSGKFDDLKDSARGRYGKWLNRTTLAMGREEDHHYVGQTACAVGSLALGAGIVYLLDPTQGPERRAKLVNRGAKTVHETGEFFRRVGGHIATRGRRVAATGRSQVQSLSSKFSAEPVQNDVAAPSTATLQS